MDIGGTIANLIAHLLPNHDGKWVSRRWISDELSPLLQAMSQKDDMTAGIVEYNSKLANIFLILIAIVSTFMVILGVVIYICYKQTGKVSKSMNDGIHFALNEIGARAPNRLPSFRV